MHDLARWRLLRGSDRFIKNRPAAFLVLLVRDKTIVVELLKIGELLLR